MISIIKEVKSEVNNETYRVRELKVDSIPSSYILEKKVNGGYMLIQSSDSYARTLSDLGRCLKQKLS